MLCFPIPHDNFGNATVNKTLADTTQPPVDDNRSRLSLHDEITELQSQIRNAPGKVDLRVHLFQLLCLIGNWQRAVAQLQVCAQLDPKTIPMAQTYREALRCELVRAEVFAGKRLPQVVGTPPEWLGWLIESQQRLACGDIAGSRTLREQALDAAPETPGNVDGVPFSWMSDADSRMGPVIEAIINGQYYWIPFSQFKQITFDAPADLRDLVWLPARLTFINDGQTVALIPVRYAGSELADDAAKRSCSTSWNQIDDATYAGIGQRLLTTDTAEYALLDVRQIQFDSVPT